MFMNTLREMNLNCPRFLGHTWTHTDRQKRTHAHMPIYLIESHSKSCLCKVYSTQKGPFSAVLLFFSSRAVPKPDTINMASVKPETLYLDTKCEKFIDINMLELFLNMWRFAISTNLRVIFMEIPFKQIKLNYCKLSFTSFISWSKILYRQIKGK